MFGHRNQRMHGAQNLCAGVTINCSMMEFDVHRKASRRRTFDVIQPFYDIGLPQGFGAIQGL